MCILFMLCMKWNLDTVYGRLIYILSQHIFGHVEKLFLGTYFVISEDYCCN